MICTCIHEDGSCTREATFRVSFDGTPQELDWCRECVDSVPNDNVARMSILGDIDG